MEGYRRFSTKRSSARWQRPSSAWKTSERKHLVAELVKCGERPCTAWSDDSATTPAEPWASMKLATLRARVAMLAKSVIASEVCPPVVEQKGESFRVDGQMVELSAAEVAACKAKGADPARYAAIRLRQGMGAPKVEG